MAQGRLQTPVLKRLKTLMYISPVVTALSITVLMWTYRSDRNVQSWLNFYRGVSHTSLKWPEPMVQRGCQEPSCVHNYSALEVSLEEKDFIFPVTGTKTLLISAYLEHRLREQEVRVVAVVLRSETVLYRCLLCCQGKLHVSSGVSRVHSDHFQFPYGTADIMCPVPSACHPPSHITVTSAEEGTEL